MRKLTNRQTTPIIGQLLSISDFMNRDNAIRQLAEWDRTDRCVFAVQDLAHLFPEDVPGAFNNE